MSNLSNKSFDMNVSFIRITATLCVLMAHTCSTIVTNPDLFSFTGTQAKFLYALFRLSSSSVPLFLMISGRLMLSGDRQLTYSVVCRKYIKRILLALVIFSIPLAAAKTFMETKSLSPVSIVKAFFCNESFSHFWYLYTLLAIYFVLPVLKNAVKNSDDHTVMVFLCLLGVFDFLVPMISELTGWEIAFFIPFTYAVFFFVAGYFIHIIPKKKAYSHAAAVLSAVSGCAIVALECFKAGTGLLEGRANLIIAVFSVSTYYLLTMIPLPAFSDRIRTIVWKTDRLCFGVYLIHPIFIQFTYRMLKITPCDFTLYPIMTILFFAAFTLCAFALSFLINLIPWFRKNVL